MILLNFSGIDRYQLDEWLDLVPKHWKKHRGTALWGVGMELKSVAERQMQQVHLVITDWEFTWTRGSKTTIVFLFDLQEDSCEVFVSWYKAHEDRVAKTLEDAFENLSVPY